MKKLATIVSILLILGFICLVMILSGCYQKARWQNTINVTVNENGCTVYDYEFLTQGGILDTNVDDNGEFITITIKFGKSTGQKTVRINN